MKGDVHILGTESILEHASDFYRELFGPGTGDTLELDDGLWPLDEWVTDEENLELTKQFQEEEIRRALFQMERNKIAEPDGFPIEFFQTCWEFMKEDICELFMDFHVGTLDIKRLNYGTITLLPKVKDANRIQQFRPICLLNCLYKWFTKLLTMRLEPVAKRLIHKSRSAFIQGRNIMNGVMALHEILHETKRRKEVGVLLKIDFEKAYDKVHWGFLVKCFKAIGFCDMWCSWLNQVLYNGTIALRVNNVNDPYFQSHKGVRQGTPFPPFFLTLWLIH
jgi:hypothetical protein